VRTELRYANVCYFSSLKFVMKKLLALLSNRFVIWTLLAIPGIVVLWEFAEGEISEGRVVHETGEFAVRFLIVTLIATPLAMMFPSTWLTRWLVLNRRYFGLASFGYAFVHALFYLREEGSGQVAEEFFRFGILTGWIAFFIFILLAITSNDLAMRELGPTWKRIQRWVYLAAVLTILHWVYVDLKHQEWVPALLHFSPVIVLSVYRIWYVYFRQGTTSKSNG
jgi:methionine sulfoxide reductase heme-binding subunit